MTTPAQKEAARLKVTSSPILFACRGHSGLDYDSISTWKKLHGKDYKLAESLAHEVVPKNAYGQYDDQDYFEAVKVCLWLIPVLKMKKNMAFISWKEHMDGLKP